MMTQVLAQTDLAAGVVGIVVFLAAVFIADASIPLALVPAVLAYAGARLALMRTGKKSARPGLSAAELARVLAECERTVAAIRQLAGRLTGTERAAVRGQILGIARSGAGVLEAVRNDANKQQAAPRLLNGLTTIHRVTEQYVRLSGRGLQSEMARDALQKAEQEALPSFQRWLDDQLNQLHVGDIAELSVDSSMAELLLSPIDLEATEPERPSGRPDR